MSSKVKIVLALLIANTLHPFNSIEARFRFPFNKNFEESIRRQPIPFNPSGGLSAAHRAVSYENINLNRQVPMHSRISSSSLSSSESIHRFASSIPINTAESSVIMAESNMHREAASILNGARSTFPMRRIPQFIALNRGKIDLAGKIAEKSGIALAAGGGIILIKDSFSSREHINENSNDGKINDVNANDSTEDKINRDASAAASPTASPTASAAASPTASVTVKPAVVAATVAASTTTIASELYNPIGQDK